MKLSLAPMSSSTLESAPEVVDFNFNLSRLLRYKIYI